MMILRSSTSSPFGRKVTMASQILGLFDRIRIEPAQTMDPNDTIRSQNPLGKIPILIDGDRTLYDSVVILEYLDMLAGGGRIIPPEPGPRFAALTLQALADGILDASILRVYEVRYRPEERRHPDWVDYQAGKVARALAALEAEPPLIDTLHVGNITLASALGYLDFRFGGEWRRDHPALVAWLDEFAERTPAFAATTPSDPAPTK